jgi:phosphoribosyl 1,2-cyclic phosphodiesterase
VRPLKLHVLASGSAGNAVLVEDGDSALLVDAGLSARELERRLRLVGREPAGLQGILITHEHGDHVRGVRLFARRHGLPVYATEGTWHGLGAETLAELAPLRRLVDHGVAFAVPGCGIRALPIRTEHDTRAPVGYVFTSGCSRYRAGVATDTGHAGLMPRELAGCQLLVLEFNHDVALLKGNPRYPRSLKDRILGSEGHLSNEQAALLLRKMFHIDLEQRLESLVLAHLSEQNNTPELALEAARAVLRHFNLEQRVEVKVAGPAAPVTVAVRR